MPTYAPNFEVIPVTLGIGTQTTKINSAVIGRHFIPQPFVGVSLIAPELWGNFNFTPGYVGAYYREQWYLENQVHPVAYSLFSGNLPPGLVLTNLGATAEGQIDGTPTTPGTYNFTLLATGPSLSGSHAFTIVISPPPSGTLAFLGGCGGP